MYLKTKTYNLIGLIYKFFFNVKLISYKKIFMKYSTHLIQELLLSFVGVGNI
tara:strand:- start:175 stop:330 length:156 start_codon:yes stop_codon:yes gene_type:complete